MALVAGIVAVVIAGLILFSRERRGIDMAAGAGAADKLPAHAGMAHA